MRAVGIHVFAGGFTMGVQRVADVQCQLEVHDVGLDTARQFVEVHQSPAESWPETNGELAYGNPRCTAWSSLTGGLSEDSHGAFAAQSCDAVEFCQYSAGRFDVCVWESVQQAYTTGRPFVEKMYREIFADRGYRLCHLFVNAASFGNAQLRRRYFFVAYRRGLKFNVSPPLITTDYHPTLFDAMWHLRSRETSPWQEDYDRDTTFPLTDDEREVLPRLYNGWGLNALGHYERSSLTERQKRVYDMRSSDKPFSLHCVRRLPWMTWSPTIHSGAKKWIHPDYDRTLTVGELATVMGWPEDITPRGPDPAGQIAKGVVPDVGEWLAQQVMHSLDGVWDDEWETSYNPNTGTWDGESSVGKDVKTFDLTKFYAKDYELYRFPDEAWPKYRFVYDPKVHGPAIPRRLIQPERTP